MKLFEVPEDYPQIPREAEASSRLEGIDTRDDVRLNQLKAQILGRRDQRRRSSRDP